MAEEDNQNNLPEPQKTSASNQIDDIIEKEAEEALKGIPEEKRKKIISSVRMVVCSRFHRGPLPCPEDIALYNQYIPNGADRIMKMAEDQLHHRIEIEKIVIKSQQTQGERGQYLGLLIGLFGIGAGALLAYLGHDWVGGIIAGTTVVSLVSVFVLGKKSQRHDLKEKKATPDDTDIK